ncbi:MAG: BatD family protein [bacterium]
MRIILSSLLIEFLFFGSSFSQNTDTTAVYPEVLNGRIKTSVRVNPKEVPQNRTVTYTVEISWQGDLDRYEIEKFENPVLTNLEIVGNSSSNWVGELAGVMQAVKTYEFVLKPLALGMAYIDGLIIEYKDKERDKSHRLVTNRLEVKVIDPIIEGSSDLLILTGAIILSLVVISGGGFLILKRKKAREAEEQLRASESIPIEEKYLSELKEKVILQKNEIQESFSNLSKIIRKYLSERYQISALEITTQEILTDLKKIAVSERIIEAAEELLNSCDVAKFSGGQVERSGLERAYTLFEDILDRNKSEYGDFDNNQKTIVNNQL